MNRIMTLNSLKTGELATIKSIDGDEMLKARIGGLGLRAGQKVTIVRRAMMGGPLQVRAEHTDVLMRSEQAGLIKLV